MRSGQYKLAGAGLRGPGSQVTVGHFRSSQTDLLPSESPVGDFPHMNSLVVTKSKLSDCRPINKSCENLSTSGGGARSAVTRVEQRVKSLLQRGESRGTRTTHDPAEDVWQYGHVVTLPRRPRLSLALSHSALHHLSSDTASCISASSGYSSSSSSSYGSFKSSTSSSCSTLPRKKSRSECGGEGEVPPPLARSCTLVDNPMYDVTPATDPRNFSHNKSPKRRSTPSPRHEPIYDLTPDADPYSLDPCERRRGSTHDPIYDVIPGGDPSSPYHRESRPQGHDNHLYDLVRPSRILTPDSGTHGGLDSLEESALDSLECDDAQTGMLEDELVKEEDQVARECREYFERRLKNSETLKKRWSMCSSDSGADSGDSDLSPASLPTASTASNTSSTSTASNTSSPSTTSSTSSHSSSTTQVSAPTRKTPLDQKMEFLRREIASLMSQDNALFRQLLTLHESISALKTTPTHAHRAPSPTSLDSFTEEEEEEEEGEDDDDDDDDDDQVVVGGRGEKTGGGGREENLSDVDEGLELDHSTSHSTSPTSTLSSNSSRDSQFSRYSSKAAHTSPDSSPTQPSRTTHHTFQRATSSPHTTQDGQVDHNGPANLAFMRSRKSYAPNARNRRRSSSAHLLGRPDSEALAGQSGRPPQGESTATLGRTNTHKTTSMRVLEGSAPQSGPSPGHRWGPDTPAGRPRSSSTVVTAAEYCSKTPSGPPPPPTTARATTAARPLVRTPYREALIM